MEDLSLREPLTWGLVLGNLTLEETALLPAVAAVVSGGGGALVVVLTGRGDEEVPVPLCRRAAAAWEAVTMSGGW